MLKGQAQKSVLEAFDFWVLTLHCVKNEKHCAGSETLPKMTVMEKMDTTSSGLKKTGTIPLLIRANFRNFW